MAVTSILNERFDTCVVIGKKGMTSFFVVLCLFAKLLEPTQQYSFLYSLPRHCSRLRTPSNSMLLGGR